MRFDLESLAWAYKMFGRPFVERMLTIPGGPLIAKAKANKDDPAEMIAKRDAARNAFLDLVEEYANLDDD